MIDVVTLAVSLALLAYILFRAVILDKSLPWFGPPTGTEATGAEATGTTPDRRSVQSPSSRAKTPSPARPGRRFQPRFNGPARP